MRYGSEVLRSPEGVNAGGSGGTTAEGGRGENGGSTAVSGNGSVNGSDQGTSSQSRLENNGGQNETTSRGGSWFDKLTPEDKTWAESKGWKSDTDTSIIADSYKNLEKLFGADKAGRTVMLPKDADDKDAVNAIFTKLGKPEKADGYSITLPEGADPGFSNLARETFHKANLTADQAKVVTDWYQAMEMDLVKEQNDRLAQGEDNLKKEWGVEFDKNKETARAAWTAAGVPTDLIDKMTAVDPVMTGKMMEFFGRNYIEAGPPNQESRGAPGFSNVTPASAQSRIDQLWQDKNFMDRYNNPDPKIREGAMMEMDNLSKVAVNGKR